MKVQLKAWDETMPSPRYTGPTDHNLLLDQVYDVIEMSHGGYRILNANHEPMFYRTDLFDVVDSTIPSHWKQKTFPHHPEWFLLYPPEFEDEYFFEYYFDSSHPKHYASRQVFLEYIERYKISNV